MERFASLIVLLFIGLNSFCENKQLEKLDSLIVNRSIIANQKEQHLSELRDVLFTTNDSKEKLRLMEQLYQEYLAYRYDSAMVYARRGMDLAKSIGDQDQYTLSLMHCALLDARGGFYNESESILKTIIPDEMNDNLKYEYYITSYWLALYSREFAADEKDKSAYDETIKESLQKAISYDKTDSINHLYLMAEYANYIEDDSQKAFNYYNEVVEKAPVRSKLYASAAFMLSRKYLDMGEYDMYEYWLTNAAISDLSTPLKENLALQELAMYLFEKDHHNVERATQYIYCSMEDAQFFNNRLRLIDLSHRFPVILTAYTDRIKSQRNDIFYGMIGLVLLTIAVLCSQWYIRKQNKKLQLNREQLELSHQQLHDEHETVKQKNALLERQGEKLSALNEQLLDTNRKREGLAKIYIDLCAKYIDKLKKYQTLVKRKIKANQVSELLTTMQSERISEEDAATFMNKFDKAFLDLYPTFVSELNTLLQPDGQIILKRPNTLTNELRIYALIRLGVKESYEIADLLFFSPQTIYNYRSAVKNRALNKETFEDEVKKLCTVISE